MKGTQMKSVRFILKQTIEKEQVIQLRNTEAITRALTKVRLLREFTDASIKRQEEAERGLRIIAAVAEADD
jgi:hypothetical protein